MHQPPPMPPPPEFLMFYIRYEDGSRSRSTYLNANKSMLDAWQAFEERGMKGVLCIVRENGQEVRKVLDYENHRLTDMDAQ